MSNMIQQAKVHIKLDNLYKVAKLKQRVMDVAFQDEIHRFRKAIKGSRPENIILRYTDEADVEHRMTLAEATERGQMRTIRAIALVGGCIEKRENDCDSPVLLKLYGLELCPPTSALAHRGKIFTQGRDLRINCISLPEFQDELLK